MAMPQNEIQEQSRGFCPEGFREESFWLDSEFPSTLTPKPFLSFLALLCSRKRATTLSDRSGVRLRGLGLRIVTVCFKGSRAWDLQGSSEDLRLSIPGVCSKKRDLHFVMFASLVNRFLAPETLTRKSKP